MLSRISESSLNPLRWETKPLAFAFAISTLALLVLAGMGAAGMFPHQFHGGMSNFFLSIGHTRSIGLLAGASIPLILSAGLIILLIRRRCITDSLNTAVKDQPLNQCTVTVEDLSVDTPSTKVNDTVDPDPVVTSEQQSVVLPTPLPDAHDLLQFIEIRPAGYTINADGENTRVLRFLILLKIEETKLSSYRIDDIVKTIKQVIQTFEEKLGLGCIFRFRLSINSKDKANPEQLISYINIVFDQCEKVVHISGNYEGQEDNYFGAQAWRKESIENRNSSGDRRARKILELVPTWHLEHNWWEKADAKFEAAAKDAHREVSIHSESLGFGDATITTKNYSRNVLFKDLNFDKV